MYRVHLHTRCVYKCIELVQLFRQTWGKSVRKGVSDKGSTGRSSLALKMIPGKAQGSRCLSHHTETWQFKNWDQIKILIPIPLPPCAQIKGFPSLGAFPWGSGVIHLLTGLLFTYLIIPICPSYQPFLLPFLFHLRDVQNNKQRANICTYNQKVI